MIANKLKEVLITNINNYNKINYNNKVRDMLEI